jgi:protein phosphatase
MQTEKTGYTLKFETGAATHVGRVREVNEDGIIARPDLGLWAVADGVGGHDAGRLASSTVIDALDTLGPTVSQSDQIARFEARIHTANQQIHALCEARDGATMGSTVAAMVAYERAYACIWAGDSRVYLARGGMITQLSRDHSEAQELVDQGVLTPEEARTYARRNVITRAIGVFDDPGLEVRVGTIAPGDTFLICSDGLTGHLSDNDILTVLTGQRAQAACDLLVEETLARGATDNVSVIVVRCHRAENTSFFPASDATVGGEA